MGPKSLIQTIRQSVTPALGASGLIPVSKYDREPLLSGQVHVSFLVDTSPSLEAYGDRVRMGCRQFSTDIQRDPWLRERSSVTAWRLADEAPAERVVDAVPASRLELPAFKRCTHTPLFAAVNVVLDDSVRHAERLRSERHVDVACRCVVVVSDFMATDRENQNLAREAVRRAGSAGVNLLLVTVGDVDLQAANDLAQAGRPPVALESVEDFAAFFQFLRRSLRARSMSMPGSELRLDFQGRSLRID